MLIFLGIFVWIVCGIFTYGLNKFEENQDEYSDKDELWFILISCFGFIGLIATVMSIKELGHKLGLKFK